MSKRPARDGPSPGNPANIKLDAVTPLWLCVSDDEKYLLLEDDETGDVLIPLIYMKAFFEANYSRKLSSLRHRAVTTEGELYWQWAFESPHNVKIIVRRELGEENTPQGHLRLVLVPIVYNAMSQRDTLRSTGLYNALHRAIKASTYYPLVQPALGIPPERPSPVHDDTSGQLPLFYGPRDLQLCAQKYMCTIQDTSDLGAERARRQFASNPLQVGESYSNSEGAPDASQPSGSHRSPVGFPKPLSYRPPSLGRLPVADSELAGLSNDMKDLGRQMSLVQTELEQTRQELGMIKSCLIQVYGILLHQPTNSLGGSTPPAHQPRPMNVPAGPSFLPPPMAQAASKPSMAHGTTTYFSPDDLPPTGNKSPVGRAPSQNPMLDSLNQADINGLLQALASPSALQGDPTTTSMAIQDLLSQLTKQQGPAP